MRMAAADRRRKLRAPVRVPIRISTLEPETDPWTGRPYFRTSREVSGNLSTGGVFVRTRDPLSPGRRVLVEVELPGSETFEATARVAWCRVDPGRRPHPDTGIGIEFLGAASDQAERLERFLRRRGSAET